jgi:hypothetical protein
MQTQTQTLVESFFETDADHTDTANNDIRQLSVEEVDCVSGTGWTSWSG